MFEDVIHDRLRIVEAVGVVVAAGSPGHLSPARAAPSDAASSTNRTRTLEVMFQPRIGLPHCSNLTAGVALEATAFGASYLVTSTLAPGFFLYTFT